jgi:hypothetical protein
VVISALAPIQLVQALSQVLAVAWVLLEEDFKVGLRHEVDLLVALVLLLATSAEAPTTLLETVCLLST